MWWKHTRWIVLVLLGSSIMGAGSLPDFKVPERKRKQDKVEPPVPQKLEPAVKVEAVPNPDDAVKLALLDLADVHPDLRCYTRYLFLPDGLDDPRSMKTTSLALNYISRAPDIYRPKVVANGLLLRLNLMAYAPREIDLIEWLKLWEEFQFSPTFSLLITPDTIKFAHLDIKELAAIQQFEEVPQPDRVETIYIDHPGGDYTYPDDYKRVLKDIPAGEYKVYLYFKVPPKRVAKEVSKDDVFRFNSRGIDPLALAQLQELTHSQAPIVEHLYFKKRVLQTIKDENVSKVYSTVFGGLYYEFEGVGLAKDNPDAVKAKASDLDLFFEQMGLGSIKGGLKVEGNGGLFDKLRSDQRVAMFKSLVTAKPRDVSMFHTSFGKEGVSWGAITGDIKDGKIDLGDLSYASLIDPRRDAREAIFPKPNGLLRFALFDGVGARQNEVPFNIANDYTIPKPHTQRLQAGDGCIRCHATGSGGGKDGWQDLTNDVKDKLLKGRIDIFNDLVIKKRSQFDNVSRIQGLYTGNFSRNISRARDDLAYATLQATGPWKASQDQTDVCRLAAERLHEEKALYEWTPIDAKQALLEMGIRVTGSDAKRVAAEAVGLFNQLVPPDPRGFDDELGILREDPRIAAIKERGAIDRGSWSLIQGFVIERAQQTKLWKELRDAK